jgi:hypothetical protein
MGSVDRWITGGDDEDVLPAMQPGTDRVTMMGSMVVVRREGREGGHDVRDREKRTRKKNLASARQTCVRPGEGTRANPTKTQVCLCHVSHTAVDGRFHP